uniref:Uncharacterized protein n=1 Tax=viral metagenome TaxID=1070528 RepID=A0A6C0IMV8_9ZZZZ
MFINKGIIRRNVVTVAIFLYICLYLLIMYIKPSFLFNKNGSLREFGIGTRNKTIIPVWFLAIFIATLSYFSVIYFVSVE